MKKLNILTAGCVLTQVKRAVELYNAAGGNAAAANGGSVELVRRVIAGEPCDLLIVADNAIIESMMMPRYADGYYIFAGNAMAIVANSAEKDISAANWQEKLLDPAATFGHFDPTLDPGGYRAVMSCMLADNVKPGLSKQLLEHQGRWVIEGQGAPKPDYMFYYLSGARSRGVPYATLPAEMDLSDPAKNELYAKARVSLGNSNFVYGSAICHALTIPLAAEAADEAKAFIRIFLETDFAEAGFIPRAGMAGNKQF